VENLSLRNDILAVVGPDAVTFSEHHPDDLHDESLHTTHVEPFAVIRPRSTQQVSDLAVLATRHGVPITPRGSGTGLSGAATPVPGGLVISFSRMNQLLELDVNDHVVVVQPGITLRELNEQLAPTGLRYPVYPGELSGSLGGNVNTNAGGMRAVRHGVTRQHVLGLELVLIDGTILKTGARVMKSSSGYDLTQLVVGSEGTLALVTEVTLRLSPQLLHAATVLVPFRDLDNVTNVVPTIVASGIAPSILEYVDVVSMNGITSAASLELGVDPTISAQTAAYLIVVLETRTSEQLDADLELLADLVDKAEALDVYVLSPHAGARLIEARERSFWVGKAAGANEILDIVVPRSRVTTFLGEAHALAEHHGAFITGCGHVGDGNIHVAVYLKDDHERERFLFELFSLGLGLGGLISGEHGIGRDKQAPYLALTDPALLTLQRKIKEVFDPQQLLNPHRLLDDRPLP